MLIYGAEKHILVFGSMNPYTDIEEKGHIVRTFSSDLDSEDLLWHRDQEDRWIEPVEDSDWKIQLDNQLPISLILGKSIYIPKGEWHRLIKGKGDAIFKINKNKLELK